MIRDKYREYIVAGVTAFIVLSATLIFAFALMHIQIVRSAISNVCLILRPVFYGMVMAFLLLPIHRFVRDFMESIVSPKQLESKRVRGFINFIAILASIAFAVAMIYLLLSMVIPQVYLSIVGIINSLPQYFSDLQTWLMEFFERNPEIEAMIAPYYESIISSVQNWLQGEIYSNFATVDSTLQWIRTTIWPSLSSAAISLTSVVMAIYSVFWDLFIAVIVTIYLLMRKDMLAAQSKKIVYSIFKPRIGDLIVDETRSVYRIFSGFIIGKLLDSLIIGIICLICCNLLKFPYPALIATIIGVTNVIPFFGPFIGAVPSAILIFLVSPRQCIYFVIFILVLQQFDGNILGPKILGDSTGIDAFWVLFSILLFGGLFGFAGMVLGVPVFAVFFSIVRRLVRNGLRKHGLPEDTERYIGKTPHMSE